MTRWLRYQARRTRFIMRLGNSLPYRLAVLFGIRYSPSVAVGLSFVREPDWIAKAFTEGLAMSQPFPAIPRNEELAKHFPIERPPTPAWCVYEDATGTAWAVHPSTEENARAEAALVGVGHRAVLAEIGEQLANAWAHGRQAGLRCRQVVVVKVRHEGGNTYRGPIGRVLDTHLAPGWTLESVVQTERYTLESAT